MFSSCYSGVRLLPQTVESCQSILVCTGCYKPGKSADGVYKGHRDFPRDTQLYKPQRTLTDVKEAVEYIMATEQVETEQ